MQSIQQQNYFIDPAMLPRGVSMEQVKRVLERENEQIQKRDDAIRRSLEELSTTYHTARQRILGVEETRILDNYKQQHRQPAPKLVEPQDATSDPKKTQPVAPSPKRQLPDPPVKNLDALRKLNADTKQKFNSIIERAIASDSASKPQINDIPSSSLSLPTVYRPPYGWWQRNIFDSYDFATGDGQIKRHDSYLWDLGRTGSCIWGQNMSASDIDLIQMTRGNGFLLGYTPSQNGILRVEIDIECSWCEHCLQTWDEFGWSDYSAYTREVLSVGILYNWEDPDLGAEVRDETFVFGLRGSGDGESSPGVVYPVPAGQKRTIVKYTNASLLAGIGVYVYIGTEQQAWAFLNDVSCNIFTNSAWFVTGVRIQTG
jgi:hypothetical protein